MSSPRPKISRRRLLAGLATLGVGALGSYEWARRVEPDWVEFTGIEIPLPHLPRAFDGFRIAQISDLHIENGTMAERFPALCDAISDLNADCIVITGDFITVANGWSRDYYARTLPRLRAKEGVFGVRGNHDATMERFAYDAKSDVRASMREGGVRELFNDVHTFERGEARLHLAGVDDPWLGEPDFNAVAARVPAGEAAVLLAHEPDYAALYGLSGSFGLMLSGHSHGGQVCWPGGFPLHVPPMSTLFPRGLYRTQNMRHYTNRGLGMVGFAVRLFSRPEVSVFTLRAS